MFVCIYIIYKQIGTEIKLIVLLKFSKSLFIFDYLISWFHRGMLVFHYDCECFTYSWKLCFLMYKHSLILFCQWTMTFINMKYNTLSYIMLSILTIVSAFCWHLLTKLFFYLFRINLCCSVFISFSWTVLCVHKLWGSNL